MVIITNNHAVEASNGNNYKQPRRRSFYDNNYKQPRRRSFYDNNYKQPRRRSF